MSSKVRVFVYGTLQPGEKYHQAYCSDNVIAAELAMVQGQLYHLPLGYPALAAGTDCITGALLSFDNPAILQRLDELEDYSPQRQPSQNLYQRERTALFSPDGTDWGEAWSYRMSLSQIQAIGGIYLPEGRWTGAIAAALQANA